MPSLQELQSAESQLVLNTYARYPLQLVRGEGVHLYDETGKQYLDMLSGIGVSALGYGHPAITAAINAQAATLLHTSNLFFHPGTTELALRLTDITGMDRVFLCNSGTEAWEAALKLARAHAEMLSAGTSDRPAKPLGRHFIALEGAFHGRTMGSVATTHKDAYRMPFQPVMPGVTFVPHDDVDALRAAFSEEVCGICIEVLQGEGGINFISEEFLAEARRLCDSTGALLLLDEIQSGMGRTGHWCAYQHTSVMPDITTLAKPLAGGIPMGAMLCTEAVAKAFTPGMHGTTFGGNPFACAVAIAVIDTIKHDNLLDHVAEIGDDFREGLNQLWHSYSAISEVKGVGLMLGLELHSAEVAGAILEGMRDRGILLNRTHDTVLRFLPPFLITREHVDQTIKALDELFQQHAPASREVMEESQTTS